jgi:hypothetical protein
VATSQRGAALRVVFGIVGCPNNASNGIGIGIGIESWTWRGIRARDQVRGRALCALRALRAHLDHRVLLKRQVIHPDQLLEVLERAFAQRMFPRRQIIPIVPYEPPETLRLCQLLYDSRERQIGHVELVLNLEGGELGRPLDEVVDVDGELAVVPAPSDRFEMMESSERLPFLRDEVVWGFRPFRRGLQVQCGEARSEVEECGQLVVDLRVISHELDI